MRGAAADRSPCGPQTGGQSPSLLIRSKVSMTLGISCSVSLRSAATASSNPDATDSVRHGTSPLGILPVSSYHASPESRRTARRRKRTMPSLNCASVRSTTWRGGGSASM
jgi:hypothetical protein